MKNPVLPCLLFFCIGATPITAQRYQGVSIRNSKTRQHKDPAHWTHEVQVAVKFPNARGVSHSSWLSKSNLNDYTTYFTGANVAYYASPSSKYSFGVEPYYDVNKRAEIDQYNNMLQSVHKDMLSALLQVRYYWYKPGDPGDENYRLYSGAGVGASTTQTIIRGAIYDPLAEEFQDWKYKSNFQYQVVALGMIGGLANFRFVGELGYGTLFIVKAGVNYRFPSR